MFVFLKIDICRQIIVSKPAVLNEKLSVKYEEKLLIVHVQKINNMILVSCKK
jgi:hypothetical protein